MIEDRGVELDQLIKTIRLSEFNDSGTLSEESSILGFRSLNIRQ